MIEFGNAKYFFARFLGRFNAFAPIKRNRTARTCNYDYVQTSSSMPLNSIYWNHFITFITLCLKLRS